MHINRTRRRLSSAALAATLVAGLLGAASGAVAQVEPPGDLPLGPSVIRTDEGPTGYEVTFRYEAPQDVESVQIYGEWFFSQPEAVTGQGIGDGRTGGDWQAGDILAGPWQTRDMTLGEDGVWTFTTALPSGTFSYTFVHDCDSETAAGCDRFIDPANPGWTTELPAGSQQTMSQVYVPSHPGFPTYDNDYQAPLAEESTGSLHHLTYDSPASLTPLGEHHASVYTPAGYDPDRATPYPTLYLSHGGGGIDTDWFTQGVAQYIAEHAIADGEAVPMVIVATNYNGFGQGNTPEAIQGYLDDLTDNLIPLIEDAYNVSTAAADRAFGGLSQGGARALTLLYDQPESFEYFGIWSAGSASPPAPDAEQLENVGSVAGAIHVGTGLQDWQSNIRETSPERAEQLRASGAEIVEYNFPGIHSWDAWRILLDDYLRDVAFKTTSLEVQAVTDSADQVSLMAEVTPLSTLEVQPTGTVQFAVAGEPLGTPVALADGIATLQVPQGTDLAGATITATYSGDAYYSASEGMLVGFSGPSVIRTDEGPTGYEVTFRYEAPQDVESVRIYGEWIFSQPESVTAQGVGDHRLGSEWQAGDILAGPWQALEMTLGEDGVWTFTTPLPSGTFSYGFLHDCDDDLGAGCDRTIDPANPGWTADLAATGSRQNMSQVYVPSHPDFPTYDYGYQAPVAEASLGTLEHHTYTSPQSLDPVGEHHLSVYTPAGYDPNRATPYPTLYLSHGGQGRDTDWFTQGVAQYIAEHAIADGEAVPMVIVATNFNGFNDADEATSGPEALSRYVDDVTNNVIPFVEAEYNVSTAAADRAFGGLSAGGRRALELLFETPETFEYYGIWSAGSNSPIPDETQLAAVSSVSGIVQVGTGLQDWQNNIGPLSLERAEALRQSAAEIDEYNIPGIHSWDVWRQHLDYFVREAAFAKTTTVVQDVVDSTGQVSLVAEVTPLSTLEVQPTGTVQFAVAGEPLGTPVALADGIATLQVPQGTDLAGATITATYSGDAYYDPSEGSLAMQVGPVLTHSGTGPTGYEVTFSFYAPEADSVQIRGEWGLRSVADATTRPPSEYQPGDFFNEALINDMTLDPSTGVWSWTTPLPPGTWSYQFLVTPVADPDYPAVQDPGNPTFNQIGDTPQGSYVPLSQVYVPQDPQFSSDDRSIEAPAPAAEQGSLEVRRYDAPNATTCATPVLCLSPAGQHDLAVYTPVGYDAEREIPYPVLYLSHGGSGNESDWPTQGASARILDNLIAQGDMQPAVVVTTNFNGLPSSDDSAERGYVEHLLADVVPFIEANYNVSDDAADRAFAGLSAGGGRAGVLLFEHPEEFEYYGIWSSTAAFGPTIDMSTPAARTRLALHVGIGVQDPGEVRHEGLERLAQTDIPFIRDDVNGVHSWDVWRQHLAIFAGDHVFAHTTTDVTVEGDVLSAIVIPSTTTPVGATGTVVFSVDGQPLGAPVELVDGIATLTAPPGTDLAGQVVTATYGGDSYYNTSEGSVLVEIVEPTPTPTPEPTPTSSDDASPSPTTTPGDRTPLPDTGASPWPLLITAVLALAGGAGLLMFRRTRGRSL